MRTSIAIATFCGIFLCASVSAQQTAKPKELDKVLALGEIGPEQPFHHRILHAFLIGQPDEPVGVQGVRGPLDPIERELDAFFFPDCNHPSIEFLRPLPVSKLLRAIFSAADALLRHCRVELKGQPAHLHRAVMSCDGLFEPSFADVAPGANHIGDHVNRNSHGPIPQSR